MKKFLFRFLLFFLPIIVCIYFLDVFISANLKKSQVHAQKEYPVWNAILEGEINSDIVIYGSSRAWVGIDPKIISDSLKKPAYNLGIDGHNFRMQYLRHELLLKHNIRPKLIIQCVDIATLEKRKDLYNSDQFLPYMLWNNEISEATCSYIGYNFFDHVIPLIRYFGKWDAIKTAFKMFVQGGDKETGRTNGYEGQTKAWNSDLNNAKKEMQWYEARLDTSSIALFENYLKDCRQRKIKMIFVYPPEYIDGQKFIKNRAGVISLFRKFSSRYDIPFLDYSGDAMSFNKKYFYNSTHLNKSGAEQFTAELIVKLDSLTGGGKW